MTDDLTGIQKTCLYIFPFEPGISFQDGFRAVPGSQHSQDMLDRQTAAPNNWFSPKNIGIHRYSLQDLFLVQESLPRARFTLSKAIHHAVSAQGGKDIGMNFPHKTFLILSYFLHRIKFPHLYSMK
jgi:hypothetical protein